MSEHNSDDDLTTDAVPSPPRDEIKKDRSQENEEPEEINAPRAKTKSKVFGKPKKARPAAFASVINVSYSSGVQIGSNYYVNYNKKSEGTSQKDQIVTDAIKALFSSSVPVERKHLIFITPHLNEEWRTTARLLNYSDGHISQFYEDYIRSGIKEVIYQLLLDWIQNEADAATVGRLSKTLWDTSQQDAVKRWSENFVA